MTAYDLNTKTDAIDLFRRSSHDVLQLKSRLKRAEVDTIVREVLDRVKAHGQRNTYSLDHPTAAAIKDLCHALMSEDAQEGARFIRNVQDDGASLEAIYLAYLAEAATTLGEWWEDDYVTFTEVSIATSRIYGIMRGLSYMFVPDRLVEVKSAVFALVPGETHSLGVRMAGDLFGKEGWDINLMIGKNHNDLVADIATSPYPIIGLSAAGRHSAPALAKLVIALRISNPSAAIVVSGNITHNSRDVLDLMGLDGIVNEVPEALDLIEALWKNRRRMT
ncbi:MAG: B12-binding domain-containing protein [Roseobacter sp.]